VIGRLAVAAAIATVVAAPAWAGWSAVGAGTASARAYAMPRGNTPMLSVSGSSVTVSWAASTFAGGEPVGGYVVLRWSALGVAQAMLEGCTGIVTALSCTEPDVPLGTWRYTVAAASGAWRGADSPQSANIIVTGL
jgi:hypothetical protein